MWRPLTREEYQQLITRAARGVDVAYEVCETAVLYPENVNFGTLPGGVVTKLADDIWAISAMPNAIRLTQMLDWYRQQMGDFVRQAECTIAAVFPQIDFDEMARWPFVKLIDHAVRAEWVLNQIHKLPVRFERLDAQKAPEQTPAPEKLRKKGLDPMLFLDPEKLRPKMVHDVFIAGTAAWRTYGCVSQTPDKPSSGAAQKGAEE